MNIGATTIHGNGPVRLCRQPATCRATPANAERSNAARGPATSPITAARRCAAGLVVRMVFAAVCAAFAMAALPGVGTGGGNARADEPPLHVREQRAFVEAVRRVTPSVVRIETVGGLDRVGGVLLGSGPTTGLVISPDGYIVSSAFHFVSRPTSVLVGLPDGSRVPARMVANDFNRMLTLLKVDIDEPLEPAVAAPRDQVRVGQWAIAVGRTFEMDQPNLSVGIVSALHRVWGKAIQTDAKVSPANYGGPLIDLHGRVLGVLVPLSPSATTAIAGVEWYDSGIGFAIPMHDVLELLPRLKQGRDLVPGLLGISLKPGNQFADPPVVALARAGSPAYRAGMQMGDRIVNIGGEPIERIVDLLTQLRSRYAGDAVELTVDRGGEPHTFHITLVDKIEPYQHPFIGVLPARSRHTKAGVRVRFVYADSPAAQAGIEPGDRIVAIEQQPVATADELRLQVDRLQVGQGVTLRVLRDDTPRDVQMTLATLPEDVPTQLPDDAVVPGGEISPNGALPDQSPAAAAGDERRQKRPNEDAPRRGTFTLEVAEFENVCRVYVPDDYDPRRAWGLLVWIHENTTPDDEETVEQWAAVARGLIVVALRPTRADGWTRGELALPEAVVDRLMDRYTIDATRVVVGGRGSGGAVAYAAAVGNRQRYRGVVAHTAPLSVRLPQNEPIYRLAFYLTTAEKSPLAAQISRSIEQLRTMRYPVTVRSLGEQVRPLREAERAEIVRWIDTLDRI